MIPITENTIKAVAALIYNYAYDQDPDSGWLAGDTYSAPGSADCWLEWTKHLLGAIQEMPEGTDEEIIEVAKKRVDHNKLDTFWDSIHMGQTEDGDEYSTITHETDVNFPHIRGFLEQPGNYTEIEFIENDPAFLEWWHRPIDTQE